MSELPESGPEADPFRDDWDTLKEGLKLPRKTDEELRAFVLDFLANRFFTSAHLRENEQDLLGMVFMPIAMGGLSQYNPDSLKDIGLLYEDYAKSLPRSINGKPCFLSVQLLHRLDWEKARKVIAAEQERQRSIEIPPDDPEPEK